MFIIDLVLYLFTRKNRKVEFYRNRNVVCGAKIKGQNKCFVLVLEEFVLLIKTLLLKMALNSKPFSLATKKYVEHIRGN